MSIITIKQRHLADRYTASMIRHDIERSLIKHGRAIVNARTLETLTVDAADACWGVLVRKHGIDYISERVLLPDIPNQHLITIANVMQSSR